MPDWRFQLAAPPPQPTPFSTILDEYERIRTSRLMQPFFFLHPLLAGVYQEAESGLKLLHLFQLWGGSDFGQPLKSCRGFFSFGGVSHTLFTL